MLSTTATGKDHHSFSSAQTMFLYLESFKCQSYSLIFLKGYFWVFVGISFFFLTEAVICIMQLAASHRPHRQQVWRLPELRIPGEQTTDAWQPNPLLPVLHCPLGTWVSLGDKFIGQLIYFFFFLFWMLLFRPRHATHVVSMGSSSKNQALSSQGVGSKEYIGMEKGKRWKWMGEQWEEMSKKLYKEGNERSRMPQRSEKQVCNWKWGLLAQIPVQSEIIREGQSIKLFLFLLWHFQRGAEPPYCFWNSLVANSMKLWSCQAAPECVQQMCLTLFLLQLLLQAIAVNDNVRLRQLAVLQNKG